MKLSTTQTDAITRMRAAGEPLIRRPGGFWTLPSVVVDARNVPAWWIGATTVYALEARGIVQRAGSYPEAWRDDRALAPEYR